MTLPAEGQRSRVAPSGSSSVAAGLTALGLSSFAYLSISGRVLGPDAFASLAVFWMLLHTVGPGVFLPLEQELARLVADRTHSGQGARDVVRQATFVCLASTVILLLVLLAASGLVVGPLLDSSMGLFLALIAGTSCMAGSYLVRGLLAGLRAWSRYALLLAVDGAVRLGGVIVLAALGSRSAPAYAAVPVAALAIAALIPAVRPVRELQPGAPAAWQDLGGALGWLLLGSIGGLLLLNAAPIAVKVLADSADGAEVGNFVAALVVARIPLFLFAAVQAALLPTLIGCVLADDRPRFLHALKALCTAVAFTAILGVAGSTILGPATLRTVFGDDFQSDRTELVLLALSTAGFMLMTLFGQALIAMRSYAWAGCPPLVGVFAFILGCAVLNGPLATRVAGALAGSVAVVVGMLGLLLCQRVRQWAPRVA